MGIKSKIKQTYTLQMKTFAVGLLATTALGIRLLD